MIQDVKPLVAAVVRKVIKNMVERQDQHDCRHRIQCCILEDQSRGHTGWPHLQVSRGKSHPWVLRGSAALPWAYKEVLEYKKVVQETGGKQVFCLSCNGASKIERG